MIEMKIGLKHRISAFLTDIVLIMIPTYLFLKILMHGYTDVTLPLIFIDIKFNINFFVMFVYIIISSLLMYYFNGATIGKKIIYMKIIDINTNKNLSFENIAIRQSFFLLYFYAPALIILSMSLIFFRKDGRSIHDLLSSSKVVFIKNEVSV